MKQIALTQGKFAIVDNEDYPLLSKYKWHISGRDKYIYAVRQICLTNPKETIVISMHQQIMNTPPGYDTHHKNNNRLDNCKKNLLICTRTKHSTYTKWPKKYKTYTKKEKPNI